MNRYFNLLLILGVAIDSASAFASKRCTFGDDCWPSDEKWNEFNSSVNGQLQRTYPPASVCHEERFDLQACNETKSMWENAIWRTNQTGAYQGLLWENGPDECYIGTEREAPCEQGLVPVYSVISHTVEDIQKSVNFAREQDLFLVVKNTGHDHMGRSSGKGAFSVWTHQMKGKEWHDSFVPQNAPNDYQGVKAVTLQAGEQWGDVYREGFEHGRVIVGGSATGVGSCGGYLTGGGVSPLSSRHGLAVDHLLEVSIVSADGKHQIVNEFSDPNYFWALRGGAGSAWGVITSATYKTFSEVSSVEPFAFNVTSPSEEGKRIIYENIFPLLADLVDAGFAGYSIMDDGFLAIMTLFNGTQEERQRGNETIQQIVAIQELGDDITAIAAPMPVSSYEEYSQNFITDPNIATNIISGSRLLPADIARTKPKELTEVIMNNNVSPGFNYLGRYNPEKRSETSAHTGFNDAIGLLTLGVDWEDNIPFEDKVKRVKEMTAATQELAKVTGPDAGSYLNEADPFEPDWKNAFWGDKYERLLEIKNRVDPSRLFECNLCVGSED